MKEAIATFDIAEHLETDADIQAFLNESAIIGDTSDFIHALSIAARAKGMTEIAKQAGVTRASLYKSLSSRCEVCLDGCRTGYLPRPFSFKLLLSG